LNKIIQASAIGVMGYIWAIYYLYLLTYYFRFRSGTRVPVVLPDGYPGNKLPGYGSPNDGTGVSTVTSACRRTSLLSILSRHLSQWQVILC